MFIVNFNVDELRTKLNGRSKIIADKYSLYCCWLLARGNMKMEGTPLNRLEDARKLFNVYTCVLSVTNGKMFKSKLLLLVYHGL